MNHLKPSWGRLATKLVHFSTSWDHLGTISKHLGPSQSLLGSTLGQLRAILGHHGPRANGDPTRANGDPMEAMGSPMARPKRAKLARPFWCPTWIRKIILGSDFAPCFGLLVAPFWDPKLARHGIQIIKIEPKSRPLPKQPPDTILEGRGLCHVVNCNTERTGLRRSEGEKQSRKDPGSDPKTEPEMTAPRFQNLPKIGLRTNRFLDPWALNKDPTTCQKGVQQLLELGAEYTTWISNYSHMQTKKVLPNLQEV